MKLPYEVVRRAPRTRARCARCHPSNIDEAYRCIICHEALQRVPSNRRAQRIDKRITKRWMKRLRRTAKQFAALLRKKNRLFTAMPMYAPVKYISLTTTVGTKEEP